MKIGLDESNLETYFPAKGLLFREEYKERTVEGQIEKKARKIRRGKRAFSVAPGFSPKIRAAAKKIGCFLPENTGSTPFSSTATFSMIVMSHKKADKSLLDRFLLSERKKGWYQLF
jgi:hypothetical protein